MRGKPTETDFLNGEIVRRASRVGISVPINYTLTLLARARNAADKLQS